MPDHRVTEKWMGKPVETLEDLLRPGLRAVCIGINPSKVSVEAGHYYQGRLGQSHFARLRTVGLLPGDIEGYEDDALFENSVGFTDIVKRPTARAKELTPTEYEFGIGMLLEKLRRYRPALAIFTFKKTAEVLIGKFDGHGEQPSAVEGVRFFVMPGPYEKREVVDRALGSLRDLTVDAP